MATLKRDKAVQTLSGRLDELGADDIVEVYNELFPEAATTVETAHQQAIPPFEKIVQHVHSGLEAEEIVDLWNVLFPRYRNVWYDEDEDLLHFDEEAEDSESPAGAWDG